MPKQKIEDVPMIENYPPLKEWLFAERLNARCLWQLCDEYSDSKHERMRVEGWAINGRVVIIVLHSDRKGWEIYTNADTNDIAASLIDAEQRLKLSAALINAIEDDKMRPTPESKWARLGRTASAVEIRDEIIREVGMMADARTPEMQAAYDAALAREGKVDSPLGPCNPGRVSFTEQREDRRNAVRKVLNGLVRFDGKLRDHVLDEIISAVLHG